MLAPEIPTKPRRLRPRSERLRTEQIDFAKMPSKPEVRRAKRAAARAAAGLPPATNAGARDEAMTRTDDTKTGRVRVEIHPDEMLKVHKSNAASMHMTLEEYHAWGAKPQWRPLPKYKIGPGIYRIRRGFEGLELRLAVETRRLLARSRPFLHRLPCLKARLAHIFALSTSMWLLRCASAREMRTAGFSAPFEVVLEVHISLSFSSPTQDAIFVVFAMHLHHH